MTKILFAILLIFCVGVSAAPPQQAPTVQTLQLCKADREAWLLEAEKDSSFKDLSYREIARRANVVQNCERAIIELNGKPVKEWANYTPAEKEAAVMSPRDYMLVGAIYERILVVRLQEFMSRHNLVGQFYEEDEQGVGRDK